ncbi:C39 family peptidase [Candidatus Uhrbacteria bacterium]|nr:C39 family peptidase [Candidatus Uhrbacteria bacterium]
MRLKIHHGYQPTDYTCGPKTLWMVLRFFDKGVPLKHLMRLAHTTPAQGTRRQEMEKTMKALGFTVHKKNNATLKDVERWLEKGLPAIINYREWADVGHYALVSGMDKKYIYLHDPAYGPNLKIPRKEFLKRWYGKFRTKHTRWFMVAYPLPPALPDSP